MKIIEQITSKDAENLLPADTVNLLWYIWETEFNRKEIRFNLKKLCEANKQNITAFIRNKEVKSFTVTLDKPVNANVLIKLPRDRFIMDIQK